MQLFYLEFGSFVLVQFSLEKLLSHLSFALEAILIRISLIGFEWVLIRGLSVGPHRAGLPLLPKHHRVPKLQPLEQTAVGKLRFNRAADQVFISKSKSFIHIQRHPERLHITYIVAEKLCVMARRKSVHPQSRCSGLLVFVFFIFRLSKHTVHTAGIWQTSTKTVKNSR